MEVWLAKQEGRPRGRKRQM